MCPGHPMMPPVAKRSSHRTAIVADEMEDRRSLLGQSPSTAEHSVDFVRKPGRPRIGWNRSATDAFDLRSSSGAKMFASHHGSAAGSLSRKTMNSVVAAAAAVVAGAPRWPLYTRSITRMRGLAATLSQLCQRSRSRPRRSGLWSMTRMISLGRTVCARTDSTAADVSA